MKVPATIITKEYTEVEVSDHNLINAFSNLIGERFPNFAKFEYIDKDGNWMKFTDTSYHTGEDSYEISHQASEREIKINNALNFLIDEINLTYI